MYNKTINLDTVGQIATALQDLNEEVIFVGGAIISAYTDDPAAEEIRPTKDIDFTIQIASLSHWEEIQEQMTQLGFVHDIHAGDIISYNYGEIPVDIMPSSNSPIGPANPWYEFGFENPWAYEINGQVINILSAPCYLATKFEAFNDRGKDYRTSHDFEDIIYLLDNRTTIVEEILEERSEIRDFLIAELTNLQDSPYYLEYLSAHIHPLVSAERLPIVQEKIEAIINSIH